MKKITYLIFFIFLLSTDCYSSSGGEPSPKPSSVMLVNASPDVSLVSSGNSSADVDQASKKAEAKWKAEAKQKVEEKRKSEAKRKALVVGCGSGRSSYELTKEFKEVVGLDMSARFFHLAVRLKENGRLNYMLGEEGELATFKEILLEKYGFNKDRVHFSQQQDLCNIDVLKFNDFQLIFLDNVLENVGNPIELLHSVTKVQRKQGLLVIASAYQWKNETTSKNNWLGGYKEAGENKYGLEGIAEGLRDEYEKEGDIEEEMKVERENGRRFIISRVQFSFWRKK